MVLSCSRGGLGWILGKILLRKNGEALTQAAQGDAGVTVPEVFKSHIDVAVGMG